VNDPTTAGFECVQHPDEPGKTRCLHPCSTNNDCRAGRVCLSGGTRNHFCADAPYLAVPADSTTRCTNPGSVLDQLVVYKVNAGGSFIVSGSANGMQASNNTAPSGECVAFTTRDNQTQDGKNVPTAQRDWRLVGRIPIAQMLNPDGALVDVTHCNVLDVDASGSRTFTTTDSTGMSVTYVVKDDNTIAPSLSDTKPGPSFESESRLTPLRALATKLPDNPCQFIGGPAASDTVTGQRHVRAFFENTDLSFVLANIDRAPLSELSVSFDVNGGARPQFVYYPATVEVSEGARIVLGPIDSLVPTTNPAPNYEAPYLFVVDQRRLGRSQGGGPTRGQLVRINPVGYAYTNGNATGVQPIYEDYSRSGNLFPIQ
jgi:hypothetical protein